MGQAESKPRPPEPEPTPEEIKFASWQKKAKEKQQIFLDSQPTHFRENLPSICMFLTPQCKECYRNSGSYRNNAELNTLKKLVGTLMFGTATNPASLENSFTGFDVDQMKTINLVFTELVKSLSGNGVEISVIWLILIHGGKKKESIDVPVLRVQTFGKDKEPLQHSFVDLFGRRYKNWNDFLSNNKLPSSQFCYPKDGIYSADTDGNVEIVFDCTAEAKMPRRVLKGTDAVGAVISVGAGIALFFPPAVIAACVTSGVVCTYGIVRASISLADRGNHNQSIADKESFKEWVSLVGNVLGLGSLGAIAAIRLLVAEEKVVSEVLQAVAQGLKGLTGVVNSIGAVDNTIDMMKNKKALNPLQSFQMASQLMLVLACSSSEAVVRSVILIAQKEALPFIVRKLQEVFNQIIHCVNQNLKDLLKSLDTISKMVPYGSQFMRIVHIIIDFYNCRSLNNGLKLMTVFKELLHHLYVFRTTQSTTPKSLTEDEVMSDIVNDDNFIPQLLYFLDSDERNYHFPSDHCYWNDKGELQPEEYLLIGRNYLSVPTDVRSHVWMDSAHTIANVHFEQYGLVTIKTDVNQHVITLKHITKSSESFPE